MTRTICDRCGKIIDRFEHIRTVTLVRHLRHNHDEDLGRRTDGCRHDPVPNDVIWQHDLCMDCAAEVESFIETVGPEDPTPDPGTPDTPDTPDTPSEGGDVAK